MTQEFFLKLCREDLREADRQLEKFLTRFADSPAYAFEWADSAIAAAATQRVITQVVKALTAEDSKATLDSICCYALKEAMRAIRDPARSTSPTSNLVETAIGSAWYHIHERLIDPLQL